MADYWIASEQGGEGNPGRSVTVPEVCSPTPISIVIGARSLADWLNEYEETGRPVPNESLPARLTIGELLESMERVPLSAWSHFCLGEIQAYDELRRLQSGCLRLLEGIESHPPEINATDAQAIRTAAHRLWILVRGPDHAGEDKPDGYYVFDVVKETSYCNDRLLYYAKLAEVRTADRGDREFRWTKNEVVLIVRKILGSKIPMKKREKCQQFLETLK